MGQKAAAVLEIKSKRVAVTTAVANCRSNLSGGLPEIKLALEELCQAVEKLLSMQ